MRRFSEDRFLADLYTKDAVQANFLQRLIDSIDNVARSSGVALAGELTPPPPVNAITVKVSGEQVHATLTHAAEVTRAVKYFVEADTNPGFPAPHVVSEGHTRSHLFVLPTFNDSGAKQQWYLRAYPQYPGSKPQVPTVLGGLTNPTPLTLQGTTKMTLLPSTGSGTASTVGQQGGAGRGRQRVSTQKVLRVGKSQASIAPVVPAATQQPVIIFTPQPNGGTPPTVVVDQSGGNGIDFAGGTPIVGRLSANSVAFVSTAGNLLLKNIVNANGTTNNPSTTGTGYTVMPEMTVTITTKGNQVLITFTGSLQFNNTTGSGNIALFRDGAQLSADILFGDTGTSNASVIPLTFVDAPSAGSHTYDIRWHINSGGTSNTLTASGVGRHMQVVELG